VAVLGPGSGTLYAAAPTHRPTRQLTLTRSVSAPLRLITTPWHHYRILGGTYNGWHIVPNKSGAVRISRA